MKTILKAYLSGLYIIGLAGIVSCSEIEIPEHKLDVEFKYELTCSEAFLKYAIPEVTITNGNGLQRTMNIEDNMWTGTDHKIWNYSIHYDSLGVSSTMTVRYVPRSGVIYQDETGFDNVHDLSCIISILEDNDGRRNSNTMVPDFPAKTNVSAQTLKTYIEGLVSKSTTRGGRVDLNGEISKIEDN